MVQEVGGGWVGFPPHEERVPLEIRQQALEQLRRTPVAKVAFELLSDEPGDLRAGFEIDPDGPFGGVERSNEERRVAYLRISQLIEFEVEKWIQIYRVEKS